MIAATEAARSGNHSVRISESWPPPSCEDALAELSLNIAEAYPEEAGIEKWMRTCSLHRGSEAYVEIVDEFALREATSDIALSLLAAQEPTLGEGLVIRDPNGTGVKVDFDEDRLTAEAEAIEIDDERMSPVWGPRLYRVILRAKEPMSRGTLCTRVRLL